MDFIHHLSQTINETSLFIIIFTLFLISFLDTLIVVGIFFPASFFVMSAGFFVTGIPKIILYFIIIVVGGLLGDLISFYLGKKGIDWVNKRKLLSKFLYIEKGKAFFEKHGNKGILFGRFLGVIKSIIPFVAGFLGMNLKKFIVLNIFANIIWTTINFGIGLILGKIFNTFYVPKSIEFVVVFLPFILFFGWFFIQYTPKIIRFLKKNN